MYDKQSYSSPGYYFTVIVLVYNYSLNPNSIVYLNKILYKFISSISSIKSGVLIYCVCYNDCIKKR
jgi:hypothetical protein